MTDLLLFDFSHLIWKNIHAHSGLSYAGQFTGGSYGFLVSITKAINQFPSYKPVVCCDYPPYFRTSYYREYKGDRERLEGEQFDRYQSTVKQAHSILQAVGIPTIRVPGFEADDIFGFIATRNTDCYIVLNTSDSDLFQLFQNERVKMLRKDGLYGVEEFRKEFGIEPREWPIVIALSGSHNGVRGLKGVGVKTALKLRLRGPDYVFEMAEEEGIDLNVSIDLATMPFPKLPDTEISIPELGNFNERAFIRALAPLGITFTGAMQKAFNR